MKSMGRLCFPPECVEEVEYGTGSVQVNARWRMETIRRGHIYNKVLGTAARLTDPVVHTNTSSFNLFIQSSILLLRHPCGRR